MNKALDTQTLSVWIITDNKPGHRSQLEGLCAQLYEIANPDISWFDIKELSRQKIRQRTSAPDSLGKTIRPPDIVIGAGHSCHRSILRIARYHNAFSAVLMKPSLPLKWFNAIICPKHDGLVDSDRVLTTHGVINKITPPEDRSVKRDAGTILLGGPSKHFRWDSSAIIEQCAFLIAHDTCASWNVFDSPRSPRKILADIHALAPDKIKRIPYGEQGHLSVKEALLASSQAWVTPDSVSMVYESLTAGCSTGVFDLPPQRPKKPSRVARGLNRLIEDNWVWQFSNHNAQPPPAPPATLHEARRAAHWLLQQFYQAKEFSE